MKIYCGISFHGYGHLAQTAPVIKELYTRNAISSLTIQCNAPKPLLNNWFEHNFDHIETATDLGIPMVNAIKVDVEETYKQYAHQHKNKTQEINRAVNLISQHKPDIILSNNSPILSKAAYILGIPCVHFCSLNWADNFYQYCKDKPIAEEIYQSLCDDYNHAHAFLRLPPHMPMPDFTNVVDIGPVCRVGKKNDLRTSFGHDSDKLYVLVSMGGMPYPIQFENWPTLNEIFYINGGSSTQARDDLVNIEDLNISHIDLIASCNVIVTKPGYGTYMEAACSGSPILYLLRKDWPEEPFLNQWQQQWGFCQAISENELQSGDLTGHIKKAANSSPRQIAKPSGVNEIADYILSILKLY